MKENILIDLLREVLTFITTDSNMDWTSYQDPEELRNTINEHITQITYRNLSGLNDLNFLFAPTGALQEHSMQNGWSEEYMRLASQFDDLFYALTH